MRGVSEAGAIWGTRLSMEDPDHAMFRTLDFSPRALGRPFLKKVISRGMSQVAHCFGKLTLASEWRRTGQ